MKEKIKKEERGEGGDLPQGNKSKIHGHDQN